MRRSARKLGPACLAFVLVILSRTVAEAAEPSDEALAETLFREGRALLEAGKAPAACVKLGESYRLDPRLGTLMNLAACHESEGKLATAWVEFLDAARLARVRSTAQAKSLEDTATARAAELEPKIHKVGVRLADSSPDLTIRIDGKELAPAAWSTLLPLDPGSHTLEATSPKHQPNVVRFDIPQGPGVTRVDVPALVPSPDAPTSPTERGTEPPSKLTSPVFLAAGGVTIAAAAVGGFFGVSAIQSKDARDRLCDARGCSDAGLAHQDDAFRESVISTVAFAVAGVGIAVAVVSLVWPAKRSASTGQRPFALTF